MTDPRDNHRDMHRSGGRFVPRPGKRGFIMPAPQGDLNVMPLADQVAGQGGTVTVAREGHANPRALWVERRRDKTKR